MISVILMESLKTSHCATNIHVILVQFCCCVKVLTKDNLLGEGLIYLTLPGSNPSWMKTWVWRQAETPAETMMEHCFQALSLSGLCSATFLTKLRATCGRIALPTVVWAFTHQSDIKMISHRHGPRPVWSGPSLRWSLPQISLGCVRLIMEAH